MQDNTNLTPAEKWENATIANNFIFYKVMHNNPDICKRLLEILLEIEIERIEMEQEKQIEVDYGIKGIRLDVYAKNATQAFNIEMQVTDTQELPERARYYQSIMDVDMLRSGQKYKELKDSYVIFICLNDIFNKGKAKYTFENLCTENPSLKLNDRTTKLFFIAQNYDKILNKEQRAFLSLVMKNECKTNFTENIMNLVQDAKHNTQWRFQYMEWERQRTYDFDAGVQKGQQKAKENAAKSFYKNGVPLEIIAKSLDMSMEKVNALIKGSLVELEK